MSLKTERIWFLSLFGGFLMLLIYRALYVPLIMDEATTFLNYVNQGDILPGQTDWQPNNHFLNSLLVWLSVLLFGMDEWVLRLPNILTFLLFGYYAWCWQRLIKDEYLKVLFPLTVFLSLFYLEFFALSRGYGLSMAALIGAIYHQQKSLKSNSRVHSALSFALMIAAVSANLNLQFTYVLWLGIEFWQIKRINKSSLLKLVLKAIPLILTLWFSLTLKSKGMLYAGFDAGLMGTLKSLVLVSSNVWSIWSWLVFGALTFLVVFSLFSLKPSLVKPGVFEILLVYFVGSILLVVAGHIFMDLNYPNQRLAMHWYWLWLLLIFVSSNRLRRHMRGVAALFTIGLLVLQLNYWKTYFVLDRVSDEFWLREQITNTFAEGLSEMRDPELVVSGSFYHERQWAYLQMKNDAYFPVPLQTELRNDTLADFLLVKTENKKDHPLYESYKVDQKSKLTLLRRKALLTKKVMGRVDIDSQKIERHNHWLIDRFSYPCQGKQIGLRLEFNLKGDEKKLKTAIEVVAENNDGYKFWKQVELHKLYADLNNRKIVLNVLLPSQEENQIDISINFKNIDGKNCSIDKARCYFYELE